MIANESQSRPANLGESLLQPLAICALVGCLATIMVAVASKGAPWLPGAVTGPLLWATVAVYYGNRHHLPIVPFWRASGGSNHVRITVICCVLVVLPKAAWVSWVGADWYVPADGTKRTFDALFLVLTSPVQEEVIFRGLLLFGMLSCGIKVWPAVTIQAAAFTLVHWPSSWWEAGLIFASGIAFGQLAWLTQGIVAPLALHVVGNLTEILRILMSGAMRHGSSVAQDELGYLPVLIGTLCCVLVLCFRQRRSLDH